MLNRAVLSLTILGALSLSDVALGRILWDERIARLNPRRFGQQNPPITNQLGQACPGQICGVLGGQSIAPLLATQPECSQQDMADQIIDASKQFDSTTAKNMVAIAVQYRQAEKNTPPDFSKNPPTNRNSVFCQKAPKNAELNCLVQAQDPANDPNVFFDPATGKSVQKGSQANTIPFCQNNKSANPAAVAPPPGKNSTGTPPPPNNSTGTPPPPPKNSTGTPPPPGKNSKPPPNNSTGTPQLSKPPPNNSGTPPPNNSTGSSVCTPQNANNTTNNTATGNNLQTFAGALGAPAPAVTALANGQFQVAGNANFKTLRNALTRSCDVQNNKCSDNANASGNKGPLTVGACGKQRDDCTAIAAGAA